MCVDVLAIAHKYSSTEHTHTHVAQIGRCVAKE
jgi:hypothetical protein